MRKGQAMIIAILSLGGAILGATAIAGLLLLYEIRGTTDSANSAKAIFAADSGIDWALYGVYQTPGTPAPTFSNGESVAVTCYDAGGAATPCAPGAETAVSEGISLASRRAFFLDLSASTATLP